MGSPFFGLTNTSGFEVYKAHFVYKFFHLTVTVMLQKHLPIVLLRGKDTENPNNIRILFKVIWAFCVLTILRIMHLARYVLMYYYIYAK